MLQKLQKYAPFLKRIPSQRRQLIQAAEPSEQYRRPIPGISDTFSEEDFAHLHVFDSNKVESMYKLKLYRQKSATPKPKAVVALFHGLTSHMNRGAHIAKYFSKRGIETVGFDFRGFGKSEGLSGYIESTEDHLKDSYQFVQLIKKIYPKVPLFGVGLSLGGATAYHLSLRHKNLFDGTVLMAPALKPSVFHHNTASQLQLLLNLLQWVLPNQLKLLPRMKPIESCRNPNYPDFCEKDPLFYKSRHRLRTISSLARWLAESGATFQDYEVPFLVVQGGRDKIIDPQVAFDLFTQSKTAESDKDILYYEQMWHDIWHEPEIFQIQQRVADWIESRCDATAND